MSQPGATDGRLAAAPLLQRLLAGGRDGADRLIADLRKGARELAALSLNYNGHSIRAGVHSAALSAIDADLDAAASLLSRVLFDLQVRLLADAQLLAGLERIEHVVDLEDDRPAHERALDGVDAYVKALGPGLSTTRATVSNIADSLRVLANNTEIAACRGGDTASAPVELFVAIAGQMRALARRLYILAEDLSIFEQTQGGAAEAARAALLAERAGSDGAGEKEAA